MAKRRMKFSTVKKKTGLNGQQIAEKLGINQATASRWNTLGIPPHRSEQVRKFIAEYTRGKDTMNTMLARRAVARSHRPSMSHAGAINVLIKSGLNDAQKLSAISALVA